MARSGKRKQPKPGSKSEAGGSLDIMALLAHTLYDTEWPPDSVGFSFAEVIRGEATSLKEREFSDDRRCLAPITPMPPPNLLHLHLWQKLKELQEAGLRPVLLFNDFPISPESRDCFRQDASAHAELLGAFLGQSVDYLVASEMPNAKDVAHLVKEICDHLPSSSSRRRGASPAAAVLAACVAGASGIQFMLSGEMDWHAYRPAIAYSLDHGLLDHEPTPLYLPLLRWDLSALVTIADSAEQARECFVTQMRELDGSGMRCLHEAFCLDMYRYFYLRGMDREAIIHAFLEEIPGSLSVESAAMVLGKRWRSFVEQKNLSWPA